MSDPRAIVRALHGRWYGSGGTCLCPAHNNTNRHSSALSVGIGRDGQLLLHCFAGCSFAEVRDALRNRGLLGDGEFQRAQPVPLRERKEEERKRSQAAQRIASQAIDPTETLAEQYAKSRGIALPLPWPAVGFHPDLRHPTGAVAPAIISRVVKGENGALCGVAREWLGADGERTKLEPRKAQKGPCAGCAVRLSEAPGPLIVAEGLWTALSLRDALRGSVWAALSTSGLTGLELSRKPSELIIGADNDANGAGEKAANRLAERASRQGWSVRVMVPPEVGQDWNDVARADRQEVIHAA